LRVDELYPFIPLPLSAKQADSGVYIDRYSEEIHGSPRAKTRKYKKGLRPWRCGF
jgi:hypothetical protein